MRPAVVCSDIKPRRFVNNMFRLNKGNNIKSVIYLVNDKARHVAGK